MLDNDHPRHAEAVGHHAKARRKEGLGQRHLHLPAVGQRVEPPVGLGFIGDRQRQRNALETWLAWQAPSDAITIVSPMRRLACMILFPEPGGTMPGGGG